MSSDLINLLDGWRSRRIVVVGDFMIDRYAYGDAQRLSPDAPVPVLCVEREELTLGGAASVCLNLRALQCEVEAVGILGDDQPGRTLRHRLHEAGVSTTGLITDPNRPTTVKHNFIGLAQHRHPQKMFRVDTEAAAPLEGAAARRLIEAAGDLIDSADMLCLEDYHKGVLSPSVCQELIARARPGGGEDVPVLVDPAAIEDFGKYRGATALTPNRTEAERATGLNLPSTDEPALREAADRLMRDVDLDALVLTLDKQGALLAQRAGQPVRVPTLARQVYDVTGAGDMVLAMLAAAVANGASWHQATALANTAAGLEVEQFGVVPVSLEQVLLALLQQNHLLTGKHRTLNQLLPELAAYRQQNRRIAFTNGCFDLLHAGHIQFLRQARQAGDLLVVGLNSDESVRRLKGDERPINPEADRLMVLGELESVDYLVTFDQDTPLDLIEAIRPDALVKGADYTREQVVGRRIVEQAGGQVVLVELREERSTTNLLQRLKANT